MGMNFPSTILVLKLVADKTLKQVGEASPKNHLKRLGNQARSKTLRASHFIDQTDVEGIGDLVDSFLDLKADTDNINEMPPNHSLI